MTIKTQMRNTGLKTVRGQLEHLAKDKDVLIKEIKQQAAKELLAEIKRTAPKDTGKFARSWKVKQNLKTRIIIAPAKKYNKLFGWLEWTGTRPHDIYPKRARFLHWIDDAGVHHFRRHVWHPGTKATPFVRPAMRKIIPRSLGKTMRGLTKRHAWLRVK